MKILIVEDEHFMLEAMSTVLENIGIEVLKADNVNDAKQFLASENLSLVITDLYLPEPDGFAFVQFIKNNPITKHIPVIVVTGLVEHRETLSEKVPADEWLSKPFTLDQLRGAVKKYLAIAA